LNGGDKMFLNIPNFAFNFKQQQEHGEMTKIGNRISIPYAALSHYNTLSIYGNDDLSVAAASNTIRSESGANYTELPISTSLPIFGLKCSINRYKFNAATIKSLNQNSWTFSDDYTARSYGLTITIDPITCTIRVSGTKTTSSILFLELSRTQLVTPCGNYGWEAGTGKASYVWDATTPLDYPKFNYGFNTSNLAWSYSFGGSDGAVYDYTLSPMYFLGSDENLVDGYELYTGAYPSDSNFTDGTGQKWVCDSIDFNYENGTGIYTKRINYDATGQTLSVLTTPTTGNMSAAEIAAFNALQLYPTNTILNNTNNNTMKVTYTV